MSSRRVFQILERATPFLSMDSMDAQAFFAAVARDTAESTPSSHALTQPCVVALSQLGAIGVEGPDALTFLHAQLTNDVLHQTPEQARLSGFCSHKGRLFAVFVQRRLPTESPPGVVLHVERELAASITKRLSMYVLRSKVRVTDLSNTRVSFGITFPVGTTGPIDSLPEPFACRYDNDMATIRLPDALGVERYLVDVPVENAQSLWTTWSSSASIQPASWWDLTQIHAGLARVTNATVERFVPQMVNFELVGGVNFRKGCYPGQEVVARSQYLGKLRRRMFLARVDGLHSLNPGTDIWTQGQAVGAVVDAAPNLHGGVDALIETTWADSESELSVEGRAVVLHALPYEVPKESSAT
ncbi:MAG TPA: folate-binding protein [Burkholderiaceae bacterium]|nr:folate-binding protein [Burkholderiaceae bacterium]